MGLAAPNREARRGSPVSDVSSFRKSACTTRGKRCSIYISNQRDFPRYQTCHLVVSRLRPFQSRLAAWIERVGDTTRAKLGPTSRRLVRVCMACNKKLIQVAVTFQSFRPLLLRGRFAIFFIFLASSLRSRICIRHTTAEHVSVFPECATTHYNVVASACGAGQAT